MRVVSDTSPLSCLASIQRLDLIANQFSSVYVPAAVKAEVMRHPDPLEKLRKEYAFSLAPELVARALRAVGET